MSFTIGQRVKVANGFASVDGTIVPPNATAEILQVVPSGTVYEVIVKWKLGNGSVAEWSGTVPSTALTMGRGRLFFPGEAPPKTGQSFGLTGQNNDYRKLAKRGLRPAVAEATEDTSLPVTEGALNMANVIRSTSSASAPPTDLTDEQMAHLGQNCPICSDGTLEELRGHFKKGPSAGMPYVIMKCSADCGTRVSRSGTIVPKNGVAVPAVSTPAVAAAVPAAPAPAATPAASHIVIDDEAVRVEPIKTAAKAAPAAPAKPSITFPSSMAMKIAADVRTMAKQGSTEMTFSLRKCLSWVTASVAFAESGVPMDDAVAAGFRITVFDRETEEAQGKLEQLFQSVFGFKPSQNKSKHPALNNDAIIGMSLGHGLNLWINGPTGAGKTYSVLEKLRSMGRKFVRVQGGGDVTRETLVGYAALTNGSSSFKAGPLTYAMETGSVLVLDEIDKLRDEVLSELTAVLEGNSLVLMDDSGKEIIPAKGFGVVATANTVGRGEGLLYGGTRTVNEALRDRFIFLTVEYDNARDLKIMNNHAKALGVATK